VAGPLSPSLALGAVLGGAMLAGMPSSARAYEDQVGLWAVAGYTGIVGDTPMPPHAIHAGVGVGVGLGDTWEIRGRLDYAFHVDAAHRTALSVDLVYVLDVLSVVPYLGVGAGGALTVLSQTLGLGELRGDFLAAVVLGLDVLLDRTWTFGVELRPTFVVTSLDAEPFVLSALARAQILFEI
jgi:hypothetical protein